MRKGQRRRNRTEYEKISLRKFHGDYIESNLNMISVFDSLAVKGSFIFNYLLDTGYQLVITFNRSGVHVPLGLLLSRKASRHPHNPRSNYSRIFLHFLHSTATRFVEKLVSLSSGNFGILSFVLQLKYIADRLRFQTFRAFLLWGLRNWLHDFVMGANKYLQKRSLSEVSREKVEGNESFDDKRKLLSRLCMKDFNFNWIIMIFGSILN